MFLVENNNVIPGIGLGTWQNTNSGTCAESVKQALDMGYQHIDTAQIYENEEYVGKGINNSDISRKDFFLATKVWINKLGYKDVLSSVETSLEKLDTSYIDLLYVHWPADQYKPEETMKAFNKLVDNGKVKYIGVSNFSPEMVDEAQKHSDAEILANQVEMHPLLQQEEMVNYCQENNIYLVAYSPLARGQVMEIQEIQEIAEKHGATEAQVSLAWLQQKQNVIPIPKASSKKHIRDNLKSTELELDNEDIEKIENISQTQRLVDPDFRKGWD